MIPTVKKIVSKEQADALMQAVKQDSDNLDFPTHMVLRGDEIIGGISVGAIPFCTVWMDSEKCDAKDSFQMQSCIESVLNDRGISRYFVACDEKSNYMGHMERFGHKPYWRAVLYLREGV